jgi:hypothetical protein
MEQTAYWFYADGAVRVKPPSGGPHEATADEVRQALEALPFAACKPSGC